VKRIAVVLLVLVTFLIQAVVAPYFAISGVKPNLLLILAVAVAITYGPYAGLFVGGIGGAFQDIVFGRYIGLFTLAGALAGFFIGIVERRVFKEHFVMQISLTFGASVLNNLIIFAFLKAFSVNVPFFGSLRHVVLIEAIYDALLAPLVFALVSRLELYKSDSKMES
jgi:rod shape-determining protein MreD